MKKKSFLVLFAFVGMMMLLVGCAGSKKASGTSENMSKAELKDEYYALQDSYIDGVYNSKTNKFRDEDELKSYAKDQLKVSKDIKKELEANKSEKKLTKALIDVADTNIKLFEAARDEDYTGYLKATTSWMEKVMDVSTKYFDKGVSKKFRTAMKNYKSSESSDENNSPIYDQSSKDTSKKLKVGEEWKVDDQWSLTLTGVTTTDARDEDDTSNPAQVVVISYKYTNIGYKNHGDDGLYMTPDNVVDSKGVVSKESYASVDDLSYPDEAPIGATVEKAQVVYALKNAGGTIKVTFKEYDSKSNQHSVTYEVPVS